MNHRMMFANNLKYHRLKNGFTQKQLSEKLGYTEKSVSKWESGKGLPTLELLVKLSEIFRVSTDELLFETNTHHYFLGIDGGGTKTVFKLVDENGTTLKTIRKGSSNPNDIGMEQAISLLDNGIKEICLGIPYTKITMFAGISGGGLTGENAKILHRFFEKFGFFAFDNGSDIENLIFLAGQARCILVIMGTGFIVYAINGEKRQRIAGWGQFFDEGGSGYTLGKDVIAAVLSASDGSGKDTLLTTLLETHLGESTEKHLAHFYQKGKQYIAEFSDLAFLAAEKEDPVACQILERNMHFAAQKIQTAAMTFENPQATIPVLFSGGISEKHSVLFPMIKDQIKNANCQLQKLEGEPVDGAIQCAKTIFKKIKGEAIS